MGVDSLTNSYVLYIVLFGHLILEPLVPMESYSYQGTQRSPLASTSAAGNVRHNRDIIAASATMQRQSGRDPRLVFKLPDTMMIERPQTTSTRKRGAAVKDLDRFINCPRCGDTNRSRSFFCDFEKILPDIHEHANNQVLEGGTTETCTNQANANQHWNFCRHAC